MSPVQSLRDLRGAQNYLYCQQLLRGTGRNRTDDSSFADCRLTTWPRRPGYLAPTAPPQRKARVASAPDATRALDEVTFDQLVQTGMLFIITQQLHPCCIIIDMHSHDAWIIAIIAASPLA